MNEPHEVRVDPQDNIYIADTRNNRVGMIDVHGKWKAIAGTGEVGYSGDGRCGTAAKMNQAYSIAIDGTELFIADLMNHCIRKVDLTSGRIATICGNGKKGRPADGGIANEQALEGPDLWPSISRICGSFFAKAIVSGGSIEAPARSITSQVQDKKVFGRRSDAKLCKLNGPKGAAVHPGSPVHCRYGEPRDSDG